MRDITCSNTTPPGPSHNSPAGVLEWTSPTGRVYIDKPISTIEFAPDPEHEIPDDPIPATAMRLPEELEPDDFEFDELEFDPLALIPF